MLGTCEVVDCGRNVAGPVGGAAEGVEVTSEDEVTEPGAAELVVPLTITGGGGGKLLVPITPDLITDAPGGRLFIAPVGVSTLGNEL